MVNWFFHKDVKIIQWLWIVFPTNDPRVTGYTYAKTKKKKQQKKSSYKNELEIQRIIKKKKDQSSIAEQLI